MRSAAVAMVLVLVIGVAVLVIRALDGSELDAVRPGVLAAAQVGRVDPGREMCERPLDIDRSVRRMGVALDSEGKPGSELELEVRGLADGKVLAEATVPEGWTVPIGGQYVVELARPIPANRTVEVCARNVGERYAILVGKQSIADAALYPDRGEKVDADWAIYFPLTPDERRSYAGMSGDILKRASVLRPGFITPLTYVLLGLALLVGGPLLLWQAVKRADAEPD